MYSVSLSKYLNTSVVKI